MFHSHDNLYFGRLPDGAVRVVKFSEPPFPMMKQVECGTVPSEWPQADGEFHSVQVLLDVTLTVYEWASIISSVAMRGESGGGYFDALAFHQEPRKPTNDH